MERLWSAWISRARTLAIIFNDDQPSYFFFTPKSPDLETRYLPIRIGDTFVNWKTWSVEKIDKETVNDALRFIPKKKAATRRRVSISQIERRAENRTRKCRGRDQVQRKENEKHVSGAIGKNWLFSYFI